MNPSPMRPRTALLPRAGRPRRCGLSARPTPARGGPPRARGARRAMSSRCLGGPARGAPGGNLDDLFVLDPADPAGLAWVDLTARALGTPPSARSYHSLTAAGGVLYVFGGWPGFTGSGTVAATGAPRAARRCAAGREGPARHTVSAGPLPGRRAGGRAAPRPARVAERVRPESPRRAGPIAGPVAGPVAASPTAAARPTAPPPPRDGNGDRDNAHWRTPAGPPGERRDRDNAGD